MKLNRLILVGILILSVGAIALANGEHKHGDSKATEEKADKVERVDSKNVCMINDRNMAHEQIPVEVDGKTYYGCCPMCKERLEKDEASRYAVDPVSGKKVDKAKAVIGVLPGAAVLYFENEENLKKYNASR